ncbi:hypothetical protein B0I21_10140 [Sphingobacterium paludis]|uniref:Uncharacterized protein n=1 Tax=Sphingobacterium paludis TaxID=1476465 RepID=A0A4V3E2H2_9SPHI|nr:hypothetical protein B0I21_10140 [Sphingobacterium paludis]
MEHKLKKHQINQHKKVKKQEIKLNKWTKTSIIKI